MNLDFIRGFTFSISQYRHKTTKSTSNQTFVQPMLTYQNETNFVLIDAVRDCVRSFLGKEFLFDEVFAVATQKYPKEIGQDKRASVSATISNLVTKTELVKVRMDDKKAIYQATLSGGLV